MWWLDDSDRGASEKKLASVRSQLSSWDWIRFCDDGYSDEDEARKSLVRHLGIPAPFSDGKVVYTYGVPFSDDKPSQTKLAKEIEIPPNVMFLVVAPFCDGPLFSLAKDMQAKKAAILSGFPEPDRSGLKEWIKSDVAARGGAIDDTSAAMLIESVGTDRNRLRLELDKLYLIAHNGSIAPWVVEQACVDRSETTTKKLADAVLRGESEKAHEYLRRLLRTNSHESILGYLTYVIKGLYGGERQEWALFALRAIRVAQIESRIRTPLLPATWQRPLTPAKDRVEQRMHLLLCAIMEQGGSNG